MIPIWAYLAAGLALYAAGFGSGWKVEGWRWSAAETAAIVAAAQQREAEAARGSAAAAATEQKEAQIRVVTRTVTKLVDRIVDRPVYRNVCLDADGLSAANAALVGKAADPARPDAAVPAARSP